MQVLLIDDHALFREGLALLMRSRFPQVRVHQAADLAQAARLLAVLDTVDCILLDLDLPTSRGAATVRAMRRLAAQVRIVVMSADDRPETVRAALAEGAAHFIPKTARGGRIEQELRQLLAGSVAPVGEDPVAVRPARSTPSEPQPQLAGTLSSTDEARACLVALDLSERQLEVLRRLAEGKSNKQIGRELDLAESTVKSHLLVIFRKLGVGSRAEAILQATRMGLLSGAVML